MNAATYTLTFITPLFSHGSYNDKPEIRPASIRGQLHWWFRALGGTFADECAIFGSVQSKPQSASKVVVRVTGINGNRDNAATLPHKIRQGGKAAFRSCFLPETSFKLMISERLTGLSENHREQFQRAIHAWLLAGSLGLRATRGGGAFQWASAPESEADYRSLLDKLFKGTPIAFDFLKKKFPSAEDARKVITDTLAEKTFEEEDYPLGKINNSRKTSPLRLTVRKIANQFYILALWDGRENVTGNTRAHLQTAINKLSGHPCEIGELLKDSTLIS